MGIDTVSWGWSDAGAVDRLLRLDGLVVDDDPPLRVVPGPGRSVRLSRPLDGLGTVGAFPAASLLYVEGRLGALRARDQDNHELRPVGDMGPVQARVIDDLGELLGGSPATVAEVRRVDPAGELRFVDGVEGRMLLRVLDGLHSARHKTSPVREQGGAGIETAYWRTPKRSVPVMRAYDKGVESGTARPGERVRLERQLRFSGAKRPHLAQLLEVDMGAEFVGPIRYWLRGGVNAGTAGELLRGLTEAVALWSDHWTGHHCETFWTARKVERLLGTLAVLDAYGKAWPGWTDRQARRRMAELRDLGLLVMDEPVSIDVDELVGGLCDEWRRAA